jgi:uncharacterized protein (TIGR02391 family)
MSLHHFEKIARIAFVFNESVDKTKDEHPFDIREIHSSLPKIVKNLFDNAHYSQATFEAFKFLDKEVKRHSKIQKTGKDLMMKALNETNPVIIISDVSDDTGRSIQEGYKFLFVGGMMAIRNPRGDEHSIEEDVNTCLDHLSFISHLLRKLDSCGYSPTY